MSPIDLYGWKVVTCHPDDAGAALSMSSQVLYMCATFVLKTVTISTLATYVGSAGLTPTAGYNGYGIWAGNTTLALLGSTPDDTTLFTTTGWRPKTLSSPVTVTVGTVVWFGVVSRCGTPPQIRQTVASVAGMLNGAPNGKTSGSLSGVSSLAAVTKSGLTDQAFRPQIVGF